MANDTTLLLFLTRNWVSRGECAWALRQGNGRLARRGRGRPGDFPAADRVVGITACDLVLLQRVRLPAGKEARDPATLAWALEDTLLSDPESNQVAVLGDDGRGNAVLAAVPRRWLADTRDALSAVQLNLAALIPEQFLAPFENGEWTVVLGAEGGFVRSDEFGAGMLDVVQDGHPPAALSLMLAQARQGTRPPGLLHVLTAPDTVLPDLTAWQATLGVPLKAEGRWDWAGWLLPEHFNLLPSERTARPASRDTLRLFRPAAWLAAGLVGLHLLGTVATWAWGSWEKQRLQGEMTDLFRQAFPEAATVVDPPLQMRRNVALLRRAAGETGPDDLVALLGNASGPLGQLPAGSVKGMQYTTGRLTLDITVPEEQLAALRDRLAAGGLQAQIESGGPASGGKPRLIVRARG